MHTEIYLIVPLICFEVKYCGLYFKVNIVDLYMILDTHS